MRRGLGQPRTSVRRDLGRRLPSTSAVVALHTIWAKPVAAQEEPVEPCVAFATNGRYRCIPLRFRATCRLARPRRILRDH